MAENRRKHEKLTLSTGSREKLKRVGFPQGAPMTLAGILAEIPGTLERFGLMGRLSFEKNGALYRADYFAMNGDYYFGFGFIEGAAEAAALLFVALAEKAAGRHLDGHTHDEYPPTPLSQ